MVHAHASRLKTHPKKSHHHHASLSKNPDGTFNAEAAKAGVAFWMGELRNKRYSVKIFTQYSAGDLDVLVLVRHKGPAANDSHDIAALEAGAAHWLTEFATGNYEVVEFDEEVIDEDDDLLILIRRKKIA